MNKYVLIARDYSWIAVIAVLLLWWLFSNSAQRKFEEAKAASDARITQIDADRKQLEQRMAATAQQNEALAQRIAELGTQIDSLRNRAVVVRQAGQVAAAKVQDYTSQQIAADMQARLAQPVAVDGANVVMQQPAARAALEQLILGDAAKKELELSNERISKLEEQAAVTKGVVENLNSTITSKDAVIAGEEARHKSEMDVKEKEISALKSSARKRNVVLAVTGFAAGVIAKIFF